MLLGSLGKIDPSKPFDLEKILAPLTTTLTAAPSAAPQNAPVLTEARRIHILYGDNRGGGHLYGTGKPCKSEFPASWSAQRITSTVEQAAANDNIPWQQQGNGYYAADVMSENIRIRIVLSETRREIITAYPVGVARNPCPANDNNY